MKDGFGRTIDENHPAVKELIDENMTEDDALKLVKSWYAPKQHNPDLCSDCQRCLKTNRCLEPFDCINYY